MTATEIFGLVIPIMGAWGVVLWRIHALERKVDKYNDLATRLKKSETTLQHLKSVCPLCPRERVEG